MRVLLALLTLLAFPVVSQAANHYIRAGATGSATGSDWTNAWTDLPANFVRGDTYYIATGAYGSHTFPEISGTSYVYLKKATVADHGTDTGWNNNYDSGQAVFSSSGTVWTISMSYLDVDGITGSGKSGHGIRLNSSATQDGVAAIYVPYGAASSHNRYRHIEMNNAPWGNSNGSRVYHNGSSTSVDNIFQYCYFHGGRVWLGYFAGGSSSLLVEYSYFKDAGSDDPALHSAGITLADFTNATIRYNVFENMMGGSNTTYIEPQFSSRQIYVYGNQFRGTSSSESTGQGIFAITSTDHCTDCYIYNNTIVGLHTYPGIWCGNTSGQSIYVDNNLWQSNNASVSITGIGGGACVVGSKNLLNGGASFVDMAAGDLKLTQNTTAGTTLASPYNVDPNGVTRGSGAAWSIGAYQYTSSGGFVLLSPSNLRMMP